MSTDVDIHSLSGTKKAAILMTMLSEEAAAKIFHHLTDEDLQGLTHEIARLGIVPKEISLKVLEEYQQMTVAQDHIAQGGHDMATRLLNRAFGENGARDMVQRLIRSQEVNVVIDPKSALFVSGSLLDFSEDLQKGGFKVTNPTASAHCSCGESFSA